MTYVLVAVIALLLVYIAYSDYNNRKERKSMLNMIVSKNNSELVNLELAENTKIEAPKEDLPPDYIPTSSVSDDDYFEMITGKKR